MQRALRRHLTPAFQPMGSPSQGPVICQWKPTIKCRVRYDFDRVSNIRIKTNARVAQLCGTVPGPTTESTRFIQDGYGEGLHPLADAATVRRSPPGQLRDRILFQMIPLVCHGRSGASARLYFGCTEAECYRRNGNGGKRVWGLNAASILEATAFEANSRHRRAGRPQGGGGRGARRYGTRSAWLCRSTRA